MSNSKWANILNGFDGISNLEKLKDLGASTFSKMIKKRGLDVKVAIEISLEEVIFGTRKDVFVIISEDCDVCNGNGMIHSKSKNNSNKKVCPSCNGIGKIKKKKIFDIKIPKGIKSGQVLRINSKGESGKNGGKPGDLLVTVHIKNHEFFTRKGENLFIEIPITFVQATLGATITIPTFYGNEIYNIKAGTQTDSKVIFKNKGVPYIKGNNSIGDLEVQFKIIIPNNLTKRQKELLYIFADNTGENYRK